MGVLIPLTAIDDPLFIQQLAHILISSFMIMLKVL